MNATNMSPVSEDLRWSCNELHIRIIYVIHALDLVFETFLERGRVTETPDEDYLVNTVAIFHRHANLLRDQGMDSSK
jgi:hypothetical protein